MKMKHGKDIERGCYDEREEFGRKHEKKGGGPWLIVLRLIVTIVELKKDETRNKKGWKRERDDWRGQKKDWDY